MLQTKTVTINPFFTWLSAWLTLPAHTAPPEPAQHATISGTGVPQGENHPPLSDEEKEAYIVYLPLFVP
ncbi:MAG: hypothetical protein ACOYNY_46200 [Caldilineaceae bacterium]|jgi:hypothetical protein